VRLLLVYDSYESLAWPQPGMMISFNDRFIIRVSDAEIRQETLKEAGAVVLATVASFLVIWGAFHCIGWVFAGFSREAS